MVIEHLNKMVSYSQYDKNGNYLGGGSCSPESISTIIAHSEANGWSVVVHQ